MFGLYLVTGIAVLVSFCMDREKTRRGIGIGVKKLRNIAPKYLKLLMVIAVVLFSSEQLIVQYLGQENSLLGMLTGLTLGAVIIMPGFIAYPLAGILVEKGVTYMVVAAFVTTLMMVGVLTYPLEKEYLGRRATVMRNAASFLIALVISLAIGFFYGELT